MNVPKPRFSGKLIFARERWGLALALAVLVAVGTFIVVIRACTLMNGIYVGGGMAWEAVRCVFWGLGHGCFFGLRLLEIFDVEAFVDAVGVVGLDRFGFEFELLD